MLSHTCSPDDNLCSERFFVCPLSYPGSNPHINNGFLTSIRIGNKFLSPGTGTPITIGASFSSTQERDAVALVNDPKPSWQDLYQAALVEPDRQKLTDLVLAVEEALLLRSQELTGSGLDDNERAAMAESARNLLTIKTEKLGWPGINPK